MTRTAVLLLAACASASGGCAALTNPVATGVPVNRLPDEVLGRPKSDLRPIPLTLLRQQEPAEYRLDAGDVLAVVASEVIAPGDQQPPVRLPDQPGQPAVVGYPVPVREDGTISIPLLPPIPVRGKTVREVERTLLDAITGRGGGPELVKPNAARVSVQLLQRRQYQVMVVREDTVTVPLGGTTVTAGAGVIGGSRRGAGYTVNLPAYENDVLRALNATGGLPGLDAKNEVVIVRGGQAYCDAADPARTVRIPLRVYPDEPLTIRESDVVLQTGDVVLIESRDTEVFYTAGLMGSGAFPLPRDYDLDVLQALALVRAPLINGGFSQTAFVAQAVNTGLGNPNPSLCTVLRQLPDRRQVEIRVDVNKAFEDPKERIIIRPGDIIVLQETPGEAITRYLTTQFKFNGVFNILRRRDANIILTGTVP